MKYVTGYLNYPKNLFFKIKLQKQYKMDLYNLLYFYLARNQKIYNMKKTNEQLRNATTLRSFGKIGFIWNISSKLSPIRDLAFPNARLREIENRFARTSIMR